MQKKKIFILIAIILVIGLIIGISVILENKQITEDSLKFKKEYESLNNQIRESDGHNYNNVSIPKNNKIKYINGNEAVDIIKNGTGIIYFGASWCPWCRNAVPVMINAAKKNKLKNIYYLDMDTIKNTWEIKDGKLVKVIEEKDGYYEILKLLDSILGSENYKIKDENGNEFDTGEKRIYMPFVISVNKGNVLYSHVGTVDLNSNQDKYSKLTKEQTEKLYNIYNEMMQPIVKSDTCSSNACS